MTTSSTLSSRKRYSELRLCDEASAMKGSAFKQEHPLGRLQPQGRCVHHGQSKRGRALVTHLPVLCFADKRQAEAARIREKYPDRIPVRLRRARTAVTARASLWD